jgi:hypothetical protein
MKRQIILLRLALDVILAVIIGNRTSTDALAVVTGVAVGPAASDGSCELPTDVICPRRGGPR